MNAGWVEPNALPSQGALGGLEEWDRTDPPRKSSGVRRRIWPAFVLAALAAAAIALTPLARRPIEPSPSPSLQPSRDFQPRSDLPPLVYVRALDGGKAAATYAAETRRGRRKERRVDPRRPRFGRAFSSRHGADRR